MQTVARLVLALAASWAVGCGGRAASERSAPAPNVLLVTIDTLRADHLGCYGYFRDTSPVLDGVARESIFFELCLAPMATTLPAHVSLLTATYPLEHGILANNGGVRGRGFWSREGLRSFAEFAREHGYRTAAFVSAAPVAAVTGLSAGFEVFDEPEDVDRSAAETNAHALPWIDAHAGEPFLLWVHYYDPHSPYAPPPPFDAQFSTDGRLETYMKERRIPDTVAGAATRLEDTRQLTNAYDGEIRYTDEQLGELIERLKRLGLWERTAVIVVGDHGEGLGEHGMAQHGYIHREQLHVPLLLRIPGQAPRRVAFAMSLVDVLPTTLGLIDAGDWSPFLAQASGADVLREGFTPSPVFSQRTERRRRDLAGVAYALAMGHWKYVHEPQHGDRLFDWSVDPFELHDVLAEHPDVGAELLAGVQERLRTHSERGRLLKGEGPPRGTPFDLQQIEKLRALGYTG